MDISVGSALQADDGGNLVEISDDVLGIARELRELHPDFRLRFNEHTQEWWVYQIEKHPLTGELLKKQKVTKSVGRELTAQLVMDARKVLDPSYDLVGELHTLEAQAKRDMRHKLRESIGEKAGRLAWGLRKDTHRDQRRIFVPNGLPA